MITAKPIPVKIDDVVVVGNVSETSSSMDTAHFFGQRQDISDVISLKTFENSEFCPRFICDDSTDKLPGYSLEGKGVVIKSSSEIMLSRNEIAMRNFLVARAAKDNGAAWVVLAEPDLFYSAQDRGPRTEQSRLSKERSEKDLFKFNGQGFSAHMYAQMLKQAGVDEVMTVHNHSISVKRVFNDIFDGYFNDLRPHRLYARYIKESGIVDLENTVLVAPDHGALEFVLDTQQELEISVPHVMMKKVRSGEHKVTIDIDQDSPIGLDQVKGKDLIVMDDMVRTGSTIVKCCEVLKEYQPNKIIFMVTHFHSSKEGRLNMSKPCLDEIITTNTIPSILNRDFQGRLRAKIAVLKTSRWLAHHLRRRFGLVEGDLKGKWYQEDMSSRNPRSRFRY